MCRGQSRSFPHPAYVLRGETLNKQTSHSPVLFHKHTMWLCATFCFKDFKDLEQLIYSSQQSYKVGTINISIRRGNWGKENCEDLSKVPQLASHRCRLHTKAATFPAAGLPSLGRVRGWRAMWGARPSGQECLRWHVCMALRVLCSSMSSAKSQGRGKSLLFHPLDWF